MKVIRDRTKRTITLSQEAYVKRMIAHYEIDQSRVIVHRLKSRMTYRLVSRKMMMLKIWTPSIQ